MYVHNVKLPARYHAINVGFKSTQIEISNALDDALVEENVSMDNLGPIVLTCPNACIVQECSFCAVYKPVGLCPVLKVGRGARGDTQRSTASKRSLCIEWKLFCPAK
jgi:hypothetical protein